MNISMYVSNERKGGLYIDLLMTVRYSHEAWKGRDNVLMPKGEFKLALNPNPAQLGAGRRRRAARACVVIQA